MLLLLQHQCAVFYTFLAAAAAFSVVILRLACLIYLCNVALADVPLYTLMQTYLALLCTLEALPEVVVLLL
jgi:hypothetical protein